MTGKELKDIRGRLKLTQVELARRLRIARNTVVRMENGDQAITPPMELLIGFIAQEVRSERHRQRPAYSPRHEGKGLGRSGDLRVHGRKQQATKKDS
jgi:transcriptional regulator with XRE-family HTH domain